MAIIVINDLEENRELDKEAMATVIGGYYGLYPDLMGWGFYPDSRTSQALQWMNFGNSIGLGGSPTNTVIGMAFDPWLPLRSDPFFNSMTSMGPAIPGFTVG